MTTSREFWFTPSEYSASWFVRVTGNDIEILKKQDVWPGYKPAQQLPFEQGELDQYRDEVLLRAVRGY